MAERRYTLTAALALDGYSSTVGALSVREVPDQALVSLAVPRHGQDALCHQLEAVFTIEWPAQGQVTQSALRDLSLFGLQDDLALAALKFTAGRPESEFQTALGRDVYATDQSDAWVILEITAPSNMTCLACLARLCALDVDDSVFPVGAVTRTVFDHIGVILHRRGRQTWWILGPRSSATDLLHLLTDAAVTTTR